MLLCSDVREFKGAEKFDYVIHAACPADVSQLQKKPIEIINLCFNGTERILKAFKASTILYLSSGVVGNNLKPSAYRDGKIAAESLCMHSGANVKIARIFSVMGQHMDLNSKLAITSFVRKALAKEQIEANKHAIRTYMYAVDLVVWLLVILVDGKPQYPYDVGSSHLVNLVQVAKQFSPNVIESFGEVDVYQPNGNAKLELLLEENYTLEEMAKKTLAFYAT
jgi:dTDP-glucose 4,6-dehydratase